MRAPDPAVPELVATEARRLAADMPDVVDRLLKANVWTVLASIDPHKAAMLFQRACFRVTGTMTRAELVAEAERMQATVKHLRQVAARLDHQDPREQVLRDAAKALNEISIKTRFHDGPLMVKRKRADPEARAYAMILSGHMLQIFDAPNDKAVAAIATAVLGQAVSGRNVASWRFEANNRSS
jgi:hypothetical protein